MDLNYCISKLALILCAGDIGSGFIPLNPVLGDREQLIGERVDYYLSSLPEKYTIWCERLSRHISDPSIRDKIIGDICGLINADMVSGSIPQKPVLLDRDSIIFQHFDTYIDIILAKSAYFNFPDECYSKHDRVENIVYYVKRIVSKKRRKGLKSRKR
ncbi:hypothetical protein KZK20_002260 [Salmonella enterica]|nr:hypothetical protein [Salmonella enterica]HCI3390786.1 hypothetical protein [Salmonella enterica subsp. enterica serovar Infantis]EEP1053123.1 hypothetical protein [Salmonella enterica]EEP1113479.1 hypothetical protein [Salmonella enterica]EHU7154809.1 hypothetical protein [Salmonella enterica]